MATDQVDWWQRGKDAAPGFVIFVSAIASAFGLSRLRPATAHDVLETRLEDVLKSVSDMERRMNVALEIFRDDFGEIRAEHRTMKANAQQDRIEMRNRMTRAEETLTEVNGTLQRMGDSVQQALRKLTEH